MMVSRDSKPAVDGGLARHIPVLAARIVEFLNVRDGGVYVDATFGAGGYSRAILAAAATRVIGIDRDPVVGVSGRALADTFPGRLVLAEDRFSNLDSVVVACGHEAVDGVVFDLGISSMQVDDAARGFSFRLDGPLDMRMSGAGSGNGGPSAADVVAHASERDLATIIATLGEERQARAIARAIVRARAEAAIDTTRALAGIVERVVWAKPGAIHPATRTFQALRIFVNEELDELVTALMAAEKVLRPGGRLVVVSFHSLEDRIVKSFLVDRGRHVGASRHAPEAEMRALSFRILTGRPVTADEAEIAENPRSRSAKLRAAERTAAEPLDADVETLPRLPSLVDVMSGRRR
ncbi:MAG TPA: 16S rRNA (cytosine(1402)-N(4))-methyltransferase RsmH [Xanthobacteraceae bacterium]|jgi:16S rRNA (cytosine1402-N4)-methyltransferase|nr:16S rRNA (cytosine(1402)-N(4))-methyltransferase RsmH [Xanthobacteraceae bacterium]